MSRFSGYNWFTGWLVRTLESGAYLGAFWVSRSQTIFAVPGRNRRRDMPFNYDAFYEAFVKERRRRGLPELQPIETGLGCFSKLLRMTRRAKPFSPFNCWSPEGIKLNLWVMLPGAVRSCHGCRSAIAQEVGLKNTLRALLGVYPAIEGDVVDLLNVTPRECEDNVRYQISQEASDGLHLSSDEEEDESELLTLEEVLAKLDPRRPGPATATLWGDEETADSPCWRKHFEYGCTGTACSNFCNGNTVSMQAGTASENDGSVHETDESSGENGTGIQNLDPASVSPILDLDSLLDLDVDIENPQDQCQEDEISIFQILKDLLGVATDQSDSYVNPSVDPHAVEDFLDAIPNIVSSADTTVTMATEKPTFSWYGQSMTPRHGIGYSSKTANYLKTKKHIPTTGTRLEPLVVEVLYHGKLVQTFFDTTGAVAIGAPAKEAPADHLCQTVAPYKVVLPSTIACRMEKDQNLQQALEIMNQGVLAVGTDAGVFLKGLLPSAAYFIGNASMRKMGLFRRLSTRREIQQAFDMERYVQGGQSTAPYAAIYIAKKFRDNKPMVSCPIILRIYLCCVYHGLNLATSR
ncbi:interferon regulatory factor 2 [Colobine gammaherpesvirus 1]|uniref:Interferon regulatory factor 2 n=1 Tax=Colobine gammaherpesvirus 1 TaxID=2597325 RepID=A0A5B8G919_9GAMA|nr:interferon regulatory factor 2 [Colobine gammaherpesvirus 1]QDQ69268.1 interferon regulatory factor 2 [Colobine gammaherpesvirus 1]